MAESNLMNVYTSPIYAFPDPAKDWLFQTVFEFTPGTRLYNLVNTISGAYGCELGDILMLSARSIPLPQKRTETINTQYMGSKRNYAGRTWVDNTINIKFDVFQDLYMYKIFYEWQNMIHNHAFPTRTQKANPDMEAGGAASDWLSQYAATVTIYLYDNALKNKLQYGWRLYDVFPLDNGTAELNAESNAKIAPSLQFNYNTWEMFSTSSEPKLEK